LVWGKQAIPAQTMWDLWLAKWH